MPRHRSLTATVSALALGAASAATLALTLDVPTAGAITGQTCPSAGCPTISGFDGSGHPQAGRVLTTTSGTFSGPAMITYTYRWQLCTSGTSASSCHDIADATNDEYIPTTADKTNFIRAMVTGHDGAGALADEATDITLAVDTESPGLGLPADGGGNTPPFITDTTTSSGFDPAAGDVLAATAASFNASTTSTAYQWTRCNPGGTSCTPIAGVPTTNAPQSYTLSVADVGATIRMRARASNTNGMSELYSPQVGPVQPKVGSPTPSGGAGGDHTAPQTRFTSKPAATVKTTGPKATVRFAFAANEPSHFQCKIDKAAFKACTSPAKLLVVASKAGTRHTLKVRAIDSAGNVDPTPSSFTFTAKRTTPVLARA